MMLLNFIIETRHVPTYLREIDRYHLSLTCKAAKDAVYFTKKLHLATCDGMAMEKVHPRLESLSIKHMSFRLESITRFIHLKHLCLRYDNDLSVVDASPLLSVLKQLEDLRLERVVITRFPSSSQYLRAVTLNSCRVEDMSTLLQGGHRSLVRVVCMRCLLVMGNEIRPGDCIVSHLILRDCRLDTEFVVQVMLRCRRMVHLDISYNPSVRTTPILCRDSILEFLFVEGNVVDKYQLDEITHHLLDPLVSPRLRMFSVWRTHQGRFRDTHQRLQLPGRRAVLSYGWSSCFT